MNSEDSAIRKEIKLSGLSNVLYNISYNLRNLENVNWEDVRDDEIEQIINDAETLKTHSEKLCQKLTDHGLVYD